MDGTSATPTRVGTLSDWASVACGYEQTNALRSDGTLWACGDGFYGELGLGNTPNRDTLIEIGGAAQEPVRRLSPWRMRLGLRRSGSRLAHARARPGVRSSD